MNACVVSGGRRAARGGSRWRTAGGMRSGRGGRAALTALRWQRSRPSACDSQVGSKRDKSGGCSRTRWTVAHERASGPLASPTPVRAPFKMWDDEIIEEDNPPQPEAPAEDPAAADAAAPAEEAEPPPPEAPVQVAEARKLVFKHWVRPKFLQYKYLYDYRHNYYDDVINYMDRRNKGLPTETPRAQTWAERALRTYVANASSSFISRLSNRDTALLRHISTGARFHRYHIKSVISRKYATLGFNTVSI